MIFVLESKRSSTQNSLVKVAQVIGVGIHGLVLVFNKPRQNHGLLWVTLANHVAVLVVNIILSKGVHNRKHLSARVVILWD